MTAGRLSAEAVEEISLHILDIAENSLRAGAKNVEILVARDRAQNLLTIAVRDDGKGMDAETLARVRNPFFTTKHKKTGLGIPLLAQAAEQAGGGLTIDSAPGSGTRMTVVFQWSHIDRPMMGAMADTLMMIIAGHPELDIVYEERENGNIFKLDTAEIKNDLDDVPINSPAVLEALRGMLKEGIKIQ
jgi:anti-sigma regulatory factor (Ser/Thr protein kinase)